MRLLLSGVVALTAALTIAAGFALSRPHPSTPAPTQRPRAHVGSTHRRCPAICLSRALTRSNPGSAVAVSCRPQGRGGVWLCMVAVDDRCYGLVLTSTATHVRIQGAVAGDCPAWWSFGGHTKERSE